MAHEIETTNATLKAMSHSKIAQKVASYVVLSQ
jgi:hypothetical protein